MVLVSGRKLRQRERENYNTGLNNTTVTAGHSIPELLFKAIAESMRLDRERILCWCLSSVSDDSRSRCNREQAWLTPGKFCTTDVIEEPIKLIVFSQVQLTEGDQIFKSKTGSPYKVRKWVHKCIGKLLGNHQTMRIMESFFLLRSLA